MPPRLLLLVLLHGLSCVLGATAVCAQDCAQRTQAETLVTPRRGADRVALDAAIEVRYPAGTDVPALQVALHPPDALVAMLDEARASVPGRLDRPDALTLRFVPEQPLLPHRNYVPLVARPGFDRPEISEYLFTTGSSVDRAPPQLGANKGNVDIAAAPLPASCGAAPGTYGVHVGFAMASDDADLSAIEHSLWLTSATGLGAPALVDRTRDAQAGRVDLTFRLTAEQARSPVCFELHAVDGVGKLADNQPQLCFHPVQGSYFEPACAVSQPGVRGVSRSGRGFLVALGLLWLARGRPSGRKRSGLVRTG
ncbi:MAG TPA: hypothetical protein VF331_26550 [Polyangiales bacterium]